MRDSGNRSKASSVCAYSVIILILTLVVPVLVLPYVVDNAFNTPKSLSILIGVSLMAAIYCLQYLRGQSVFRPRTPTTKVLFLLISLNFFSFFYTKNYHFTLIAAMMNITALLLIYFVSLYVDSKKALMLIICTAFSGTLVSIITWLQFYDIYILIRWARPGEMIMGTIGNSNYLGAYLLFPLFAMLGLIFLLKGTLRLIPAVLSIFILGAFLFSRARAGWFGFFLTLPFFLYLLKLIHAIPLGEYIRSHAKELAKYGVIFLTILILLLVMAPERFYKMMDFRRVTESKALRIRMKKYFPPSIWLFKQSPLFGGGLWTYRNMVYEAQAEINRVDPDFFKDYPSPKPRRVHNEYLEILNDGGLVAAGALTIFLVMIMGHGWAVIKDEEINFQDRIVSATAFCSIIAILLASFFFFSFRVNSTLFMTVLMMGLMEGAYLRNYDLISRVKGVTSETGSLLSPILIMVLVGMVWYAGLRPLKGEVEHFRYQKYMVQGDLEDAEQHILKAINLDPLNSAYHLYASKLYINSLRDYGKAGDFIERALINFNGDVTKWTVYFLKGMVKFHTGSLPEARAAFKKALYYNPTFSPAREKLEEVDKITRDHDGVTIKFR